MLQKGCLVARSAHSAAPIPPVPKLPSISLPQLEVGGVLRCISALNKQPVVTLSLPKDGLPSL